LQGLELTFQKRGQRIQRRSLQLCLARQASQQPDSGDRLAPELRWQVGGGDVRHEVSGAGQPGERLRLRSLDLRERRDLSEQLAGGGAGEVRTPGGGGGRRPG
jgi:hypothetical protein